MEHIVLNFSIKKKEMNAREYIDFCKKILISLKSIDDVFKSANTIDLENHNSYFFKEDLSDFTTENLKLIITEQEDIAYKNPVAENKELTEESKSWMGYFSTIFFGGSDNIESYSDVSLYIAQGSYENTPATIKIDFSNDLQHKLSEEYVFRLIEELAKIIDIEFASATSSQFFMKVRRKGQYSIGWINYITNKNISSMLILNEKRKHLDNGIVFSISERDVFEADNNALIERSIKISDSL
ncbi:hypothetical protein [Chryseobacterium caseinilyticum]|uniref:Immunity protein 52 domain-containing protein n=1 Tax=Chryseobacterium caseinilyticum TaxID=2771428 RepID=A0ABR8ZBP9_9FLAO|nr:hypothetical protein [Chryseobacterium caseinilyticum]MBD8082514.1 hypothetical protein [Chryseobacterium caseinilyticum]